MKATVRSSAQVARELFDAILGIDPDRVAPFGEHDHTADIAGLIGSGGWEDLDAIRACFCEIFAPFPGFEVTVDRMLADETSMVVEWHTTGILTADDVGGQGPRTVTVRGVDMIDTEHGTIRNSELSFCGDPGPASRAPRASRRGRAGRRQPEDVSLSSAAIEAGS